MRKIYSGLIVFLAILLTSTNLWSQCSNCNSNYPGGTFSTTTSSMTTVSSAVYGGEYSYYNVVAGSTYTWQTCSNSAYDTQLTLFQGGTCGSGTVLAYNDDGCGAQSTITWTATFTGVVTLLNSQYNCVNNSTSTTIQWACTSCGGGGGGGACPGAPTCAASPPANDNCATPTPICEFEGYCGNTSGTYTAGSIPGVFCGSVENNSWLSFTASATSATLNVYVCNCVNDWGIQMEIYGTTDCVNFTSFSNCWNPGIETNGTVTATGLTIGNTYLLMIDGQAGDICDYTISAGSGVWTSNAVITQNNSNAISVCAGQTVNFNASGGTSYAWSPATGLSNPSIANPTATPLVTTTYTVTITGGNPLCPGSNTIPLTVTVSSGLTVTTTQTNPSCFNGTNGTASVTSASGGTAPYSYVWSNGPTTQSVTGLSPGTYTVTTSSSNGCSYVSTVTIANPPQMTIALTPTAATCGMSNGSIGVVVTNGVANYTYACPSATTSSNNPSSNHTFTNLPAGTYTVTVTNASGCTATATTTINSTGSVTAGFTYNGNQCVNNDSYNFTNTGTGGATYAWTFPSGTPATSTAQNPTGVSWTVPGTYTVTQTVTLGGCNASYNQNITVYAQPTATITPTNATCFGVCNGSAVATGSGGSGTYTNYVWNTGPTTQSIGSLCPGSYNVTITDSYGCTGTNTTNITQPAALSLNATRTNPTCNGSCNGTGNVTVAGGIGPFSYVWSNLATTASISGLCAGTYTVTVTDNASAGCTQTANITLSAPAPIVLTGSSVSATCGASNGSATVNITSGGVPNYTYNWSNGANTPNSPTASNTITGLAAGSYTVTVANSNGCTATTTVNVSSTGAPTASISASANPTCFGSCNGQATVSLGGTLNPPYNYVWSNGSVTNGSASTLNSVNNLCTGTASVTVTDALGCNAITSVTVTQPSQVTALVTTVTAHCGHNDGTATVTPAGGTPGYTYSWTGGQTTITAVNLLGGSYTVTVTDSQGCTGTASGTVGNAAGVTASISASTPVSCNGGTNGTATALGSGGTIPYGYVWNPGGQTTQTATGLSATTYTVTITDASLCTATASVTISQPTVVSASISASTPALCSGACNGTATVTGSGGTPAYTYVWSNTQTTQTATGLCFGSYTVTVRDANLCSATTTVNITQPAAVSASATTTNANCGTASGTATVTGSGGTPGYTYQWSASAGSQVTQTATNLAPGMYSVTVSDANGCTATANAVVGNNPGGTASISSTVNVTCNGLCNGQAVASMGGGTLPYSYLWSNGQVTATATGLCAGSYTVTITDANLCTATATANITQPAVLSTSMNVLDVLCFGDCNGQITVTPAGGTAPYSYMWSNLFAGAVNTNLCAGSYTVTVTDSRGCTTTDTRAISNIPAITLTSTNNPATCNQSDGDLFVSVTFGAAPFTYTWNPAGPNNDTLLNIPAGTYNVTVTDTKGCTAVGTYVVSNLSGPTASIASSTNITCNGLCNGVASANVSGGALPYSFMWSNGQATQTAVNLCPGNYTISVTDNSGCVSTANVTITQPNLLTVVTIGSTSPDCNGDCDGTATVLANGGTPPYSYSWTGGNPFGGLTPNAASTSGICNGLMAVVITDANSCTVSGTVSVFEPTFLSLVTTGHNETCSGFANGDAFVNPSGGVPPYTYQWSANAGGQTSQTAVGLAGGVYSVTVTDDNGCTETGTYTVSTPNPMSFASVSPQHLSCYLSDDGSISVNVAGGTPNYSFAWTNSVGTYTSTNQNIGNLPAETYTLVVTDQNGCFITTTVIISQPPQMNINLFTQDETCYSFCDGEINAAVNGGQLPYSYLWSTLANGQVLQNLCPGTYTVTVTDFNGCTVTASDVVTGNPLLQINLVGTTPATCGNNNGSAQISFQGGLTGYTIQWSTGGNGVTEINMPAGNHNVTLIDINGCIATLPVPIQDFGGPTITTFLPTDVTCAGADNGVAIVSYSPSSPPAPPYISNWSTGWVGDTASGLQGGMYFVTVTDANGCQSAGSIIIDEPTQLVSIVNTVTHNHCFGDCNGNATVQAGGGTSPYTYTWIGIGQFGTSASNLCAGPFSCVVEDANGCTSTATVTVNQPTQLDVTGTVTDALCAGTSSGVISVNASGGSPVYQYLWLPPATGTNSVTANLLAGTYTVVVTDSWNCTVTENFTVSEPLPILVYTSAVPSHCGQNNGEAMVDSVTGGVGPYTYLWSPGNYTTPSLTNLNNGTYQLKVTDASGCFVIVNVNVFEVLPPENLSFIVTNAECPGGNDGTLGVNVQGGQGPYTYLWSDGQSTQTAINLSEGNYYVTVTDVNGCTISDIGTVGDPQNITVYTSSNFTICMGPDTVFINANATGGTGPYTYYWSGPNLVNPNSQIQAVSPDSSTNYSVYVIDDNGCLSNPPAYVNIFVYPAINVSISADAVICQGDAYNISVNATGGMGAPYTYVWNSGSGNPNVVTPNATTTYTVSVYDGCTTPYGQASMTLNVQESPQLVRDPRYQHGCMPFVADFDHDATVPLGDIEYYWDFGDPTSGLYNTSTDSIPYHQYMYPGEYDITLTMISDYGCETTVIFNDLVNVHPVPNAEFYANPVAVSLFNAEVSFFDESDLANQWIWNFGDGSIGTLQNPSHIYTVAGEYNVMLLVRSDDGCTDTVWHMISVKEEHTFWAPDAFSPGDGLTNNFFYPKGVGIEETDYQLFIYDRWGQIIFESEIYPEGTSQIFEQAGGWNGRYDGSGAFVPVGTYTWRVRLVDVNGVKHEYTGAVTVVR